MRKIWIEGGCLKVKLYETIVFEEKGSAIDLDTGGWLTISTARAISQGLQALGLGRAKFDAVAGRILILNKAKEPIAALDKQKPTITVPKIAFEPKAPEAKGSEAKGSKGSKGSKAKAKQTQTQG